MIHFSEERLSTVWEEAVPLMKEHFEETGDFGIEEFNPDKVQYLETDKLNLSKTFTARTDTDTLVGYSIFFIFPHHHSRERICAVQDALFLQKKHRGIAGVRFISFTDLVLEALGASLIFRPVSTKCDYSRTLSRMNYEHVQNGFMRRI